MGAGSEFFPKSPPDLSDHHNVLYRHGRVLTSQSDQLIKLHESVKAAAPTKLTDDLERLEEKVSALNSEVVKLRTIILTASILIGGGYAGGQAIEATKGQPPTVVQVTPETVKALKEAISGH